MSDEKYIRIDAADATALEIAKANVAGNRMAEIQVRGIGHLIKAVTLWTQEESGIGTSPADLIACLGNVLASAAINTAAKCGPDDALKDISVYALERALLIVTRSGSPSKIEMQ